jgi:hypothetical protein
MGRARINDKELPQHMLMRNGSYYYVSRAGGKQTWLPLGKDRDAAATRTEELNHATRTQRREVFGALRSIGEQLKSHVLERDGHACVYCGATSELEIDHIIPYTAGGATTAKNLVVACCRCNVRKSDADVRELLFQLHGLVDAVIAKVVGEIKEETPLKGSQPRCK